MRNNSMLKKIIMFYVDGFRQMTVGKTLWAIILIKLFILFAILRVFFFQPTLKGTDAEKAETVMQNLVQSDKSNK